MKFQGLKKCDMKTRLDVYLVENKYYETRNKAKAAIENGDILVNGGIIKKVSHQVTEKDKIEILKDSIPYVSRGGLKLEKALQSFCVEVRDKVCLDIGASTGGFSDCLIQNNAGLVYALDVGTNQLADKLKYNNKIISFENTNFRTINIKEYQDYNIDFICADVSFISLTYLLENISKILSKKGIFIGLIKPQFETLKKEHNKNGVVNDKKVHFKVIKTIMECANNYGLFLNKIDYSPIRGEKAGNIEYLSLFSFLPNNVNLSQISDIIELAFKELK